MIIGTDESGKVLLVTDGRLEHMPKEFNGQKLTAIELTTVQQDAFNSLPADRGGTNFDGEVFAAIPADTKAAENAVIMAELRENDLKAIRAITENDAARITAHLAKQSALRAKLK